MGLPTNTYHSYTIQGTKESFSDAIFNIAPTDTPFLSMLSREKVTDKFHQWQTDTLAAAANNKHLEGDDTDADAQTATALVDNYCQISKKVIVVSGTIQATAKWGRGKNELAYLVGKAGKELKRDMDYAICRNGSYAAGAAGTARQTRGLEGWIATNDSLGAGGASPVIATNTAPDEAGTLRGFTESLLRSVHKMCFDQGGKPSVLMVGAFNRGVVDSFTGYATRMDDAKDKRITATVEFYVGPFGQLKVATERQQQDRTAFLIDPEYVSLGVLRPIQQEELAKSGDNEKRHLVSEYCLIMKQEKAHGAVRDLTTS